MAGEIIERRAEAAAEEAKKTLRAEAAVSRLFAQRDAYAQRLLNDEVTTEDAAPSDR